MTTEKKIVNCPVCTKIVMKDADINSGLMRCPNQDCGAPLKLVKETYTEIVAYKYEEYAKN